MQVSAPGMLSNLQIPLPLSGSETTEGSQGAGPLGSSHVQVRICADNVCSLQVWVVLKP